jgi:uncharacterized protein (DUF2141 family)
MKIFAIIGYLASICGPVCAQVDTLKPSTGESASRTDGMNSEAEPEKTYSIHITVTNIRNNKGVIRFKFYDDSTPFPDLNGFLKVVVPKTEMRGDSLTLTLHGFTSKHMAIALLDDENNDVKLDMGWFLPKEGHAFSDYYHSALRRPVYNDFNFFLNGDRRVVMRMKYY